MFHVFLIIFHVLQEEEMEEEKERKRKAEEIAKADAQYVKSLIMSENVTINVFETF